MECLSGTPPSSKQSQQKEHKMQKDNNTVVKLNNDQSVTKDSYEILAKKSKEIMRHAEGMIYHIRTRFDEAFTKYKHSNPHNRRLKDFEIHEKRDEAKEYCNSLRKELRDEIKNLEEGILKYGIDIRDQEDNSND
jgi:hypothetical protein